MGYMYKAGDVTICGIYGIAQSLGVKNFGTLITKMYLMEKTLTDWAITKEVTTVKLSLEQKQLCQLGHQPPNP